MPLPSESHPFGTNDVKSPDVELQKTSSGGSDSADAQSISAESSRLYHIYHTPIRYDYRVSNADKQHLYFINNSHLTPFKNDLMVHIGEDDTAPVAAVSKFIHLSRHCKIGLGDPHQAGTVVWEDLQCQNFTMSKYRWQMFVPSGDGYERRSFLWKRTHSVGADGDSPMPFSFRNFKLIDERSGQVAAVFTSNGFKSVRKNGKLRVVAEYGPSFDLMALITLLSIYERFRRRTGGKGGGGGGGDGG